MFNKRRESAMPDKWVSPPYLNVQKNKLGPVELCKMKEGATVGKIITHDVSEKAFYPHETKELKNLTR